MATKRPELAQSETVAELPAACASEAAAVDFLERKRWSDTPCCPRCGSVAVYKMTDRATGERNKRFLWRCRDCGGQYSVRTGTVYEESLIPLHKWCRALWEAASAKNGISALEISRKVEVSYKSALFMMHRIRHAMADGRLNPPRLTGVCEADETYVGARRPRYRGTRAHPINPQGGATPKQPVVAVLQRGGDVRVRVVPSVTGYNLRAMLRDNVDPSARIMTDEHGGYARVGPEFAAHETVNHRLREYARGDVHTNSIEGFFGRCKRGLMGVYHNVSKAHLHRYMEHFAFSHNTRGMNDGERTLELIRRTDGKRLMYRDPVKRRRPGPPDPTLTKRPQPRVGEDARDRHQYPPFP